jgi:hypothetical protein
LKDLKERPELTKLTFENNQIKDVDGMCQVFLSLKSFDKLEGINFRLNNFNEKMIEALAEGIKMKKELRVSVISLYPHTTHRLLTWERTV